MQVDQRVELMAVASAVLDDAAARFVAGIGAPSAVTKGVNDFATALDLELERDISAALTDRTGIGVHGEEFGGPELSSGRVWVLDPIDGTFNYSAGNPLCSMLLALIEDGEPVIGLTWVPLLGRRYAAVVGGPLYCDGKPMPALAEGTLSDAMIGYGTLDPHKGAAYSATARRHLLGAMADRVGRVRMIGSTGIDLAWTAAGIFSGAVLFSHHPWDNAAGAALVRAAGGVVTDLAGRPWTIESDSIVAAAPGVHEKLVDLVRTTIGG